SKQAVTLPALHVVQQERGCVSKKAMEEIAEILELSPAQIHDTASFYGFFRTEDNPLGQQRIWVCRSLPCMLRGGEELLAALCQKYGIAPGETTADGKLTIELAECLGACDGAPCILLEVASIMPRSSTPSSTMMSSGSITANGSSPTWRRAIDTAWPSPIGSP
ncbi:MAG: NAD(P)H-dependent oxidoreductase subunit E, partial [Pirellula sp.]